MPDPTPEKKLPDDVRSLARAYTHMGVKVLAGIAENGTSEPARVVAVALLDRGWGKPKLEREVPLPGGGLWHATTVIRVQRRLKGKQ
jgi:hypothetical protein